MSRTTIPDVTTRTDLRNEKIIAKGAGVSLVGLVISSALSYLLSVVVARSLGGSAYGLYSLGLATVVFVRPLAMLGLNHGGLRYVARYRALDDPASETLLARRVPILVAVWAGIVSAAMALFSEPIARLYGSEVAATASVLRWFAPAVVLSSLLWVLVGVSDGQKRIGFGVLARDILQPMGALILVVCALWLGAGVAGVVLGYVVSMAAAAAVIVWLLRGTLAGPRQGGTGPRLFSLREVLVFSLPFFPNTFFREATSRLEIYLLGVLGTVEQVGLFSAAASTAALVAFGLKAIWKIYAAVAAELHAKNEMVQLEHTLQLASRWSVAVSLPAVIALGLLGEDVLGLFGTGFSEANPALLILAAGQFFSALVGPINSTLMIGGYSTLILFNNIVTVVLNILLDWWLISRWGITGAAVGGAVTVVVLNVITALEVRLLLGIRGYNRTLLRPIFAGSLTLLAMWPTMTLLHRLPTLARLIAGVSSVGLVFAGLFWVLASADDRAILRLAWSRVKVVLRREGRSQDAVS